MYDNTTLISDVIDKMGNYKKNKIHVIVFLLLFSIYFYKLYFIPRANLKI
jgi:hypothetical protein